MVNLADLIEGYILHELQTAHKDYIELRRGDIADEMECAPSQISYVLSTRFTPERGFKVMSRRGLGGFIRVLKAPPKAEPTVEDVVSQIDGNTPFETILTMVRYLLKDDLITSREADLIMAVVSTAYATVDDDTRAHLLRTIFTAVDALDPIAEDDDDGADSEEPDGTRRRASAR